MFDITYAYIECRVQINFTIEKNPPQKKTKGIPTILALEIPRYFDPREHSNESHFDPLDILRKRQIAMGACG